MDQWVCLTEERNSVMCPAAGSGVPGAPADWEPPDGVEAHSPVLFLDLNADDLSTGKYLMLKLVKMDSLHAFNRIAFVSRRTRIQVIRVVCTLHSILSQATRKRVKYPFSEPTPSCRRNTAVNSSTCPSFATSRATSGPWPPRAGPWRRLGWLGRRSGVGSSGHNQVSVRLTNIPHDMLQPSASTRL